QSANLSNQVLWSEMVGPDRNGVRSYIADAEKANPQGRLIQFGEVAALALYLCREEALARTMQDLTLSGGSLWQSGAPSPAEAVPKNPDDGYRETAPARAAPPERFELPTT
ncbi:MAG: hypothetical protein QGG31_03150, partial [Anaerolineales bacterium]|nr:hypothetical protein [Anaerolineales bacterium]